MKNMFENVKFGDKFLTRDGRIAIYHRFEIKLTAHVLFVENLDYCLYVNNDGLHKGNHIDFPEWEDDIVSKYQEQINEEKLEELAGEYAWKNGNSLTNCTELNKAYKEGYRKAKEN